MSEITDFRPQWASPPGATIADALLARDLTRAEFSTRLGEPEIFVEALLLGEIPITIGLARRLHQELGASVAFWMARDHQYREDLERLRAAESEWVRTLPTEDMTRLGWVHPQPFPGDEVATFFHYFEVQSLAAWRARYHAVLAAVDFRTSPTFDSHPSAVATWLRQGERIAAETVCASWDEATLRTALPEFRTLSRLRDPDRFVPKLRSLASACGIAIAIVPALSGCRASGATLWLSPEKALLMLSARHLTDDHLWFTLFHEFGHLLLHRDTRLFLEEEGSMVASLEDAANSFAMNVLLPEESRAELSRIPLNRNGVLLLASRAGVAPGIIVGQLQKSGRIGPERLNFLKRRFAWEGNRLVSR